MKKSGKLVTLGALMLVAVGSYFVSGTYAKYTSTLSVSDTATVAKWAWKFNDTDISLTAGASNSITFNLFDTINEADTSTTEENVDSGKIAPGTGGSFEMKLTNASEVDAEYTVDYTITNSSSIPIEYSIDDGTTWTTDLVDVVTAVTIEQGDDATITVQWRWAFEGTSSSNYTDSQTDTTDTALGIAGTAPTLTVQAAYTVTQVD